MYVTWIWLVLLFQSNVADVFHRFFFTRHYSHETNRKQASTPHSFHPELPSIPAFKQQLVPNPEFGGVFWSLVWHQLKYFPLFPTERGLRRPLGFPLPFCFQPYKRRAALGCSLPQCFTDELCFQSGICIHPHYPQLPK